MPVPHCHKSVSVIPRCITHLMRCDFATDLTQGNCDSLSSREYPRSICNSTEARKLKLTFCFWCFTLQRRLGSYTPSPSWETVVSWTYGAQRIATLLTNGRLDLDSVITNVQQLQDMKALFASGSANNVTALTYVSHWLIIYLCFVMYCGDRSRYVIMTVACLRCWNKEQWIHI